MYRVWFCEKFTIEEEPHMWFWTLASLGLAGALDLAIGVLLVHLLSEYFAYPLVWWQYAIGALLGASPDVDLFYAFFRKNASGHHEYLTHRPILGVPFAIFLGWMIGGEFWAIAAGLGAFWHYLHDTEGFLGLSGGGIAWFWPFSKKYWGMGGAKAQVVFWVPEVHQAQAENRNTCDEFRKTYLLPTRRSVTEFMLTSIALGYVIADLFDSHIFFPVVILFWAGILGLWISYSAERK
ncbi:MAG: metal-dependent hydrolase [Candidatus Uhrbacteria bacterium]|nr:metal-dependent hydrolase [Candidatus Uhrbacteria bacterium]